MKPVKPGVYDHEVEVEYDDPVYERDDQTAPGETRYRAKKIGTRRMRCKVVVTIDLAGIVRTNGVKAARSKTGRSQDGHVVVKRVGLPTVVSETPA